MGEGGSLAGAVYFPLRSIPVHFLCARQFSSQKGTGVKGYLGFISPFSRLFL